jgi:hypothetical protein
MNKELKAKWIEALRSGKYMQLSPAGSDWVRYGRHCCLGVLGDLLGKQKDMEDRRLGGCLNGVGVSFHTKDVLICMNDGINGYMPRTFAEIADYIEENVPVS